MIPQRRVRCCPTTALKGACHSPCAEGAGATVVIPPVGGTWWPRSLVGWSAIRVDAHRWGQPPDRTPPSLRAYRDDQLRRTGAGCLPRWTARHRRSVERLPLERLLSSSFPRPCRIHVGMRRVHPDPGGRDRLIGIRAPSGSSCDCYVRRQLASTHDQTGGTMSTAPTRGPETVSERSVRQRSRSVTCAPGLQSASWASGRLARRPL
jgi:hypothetical protein